MTYQEILDKLPSSWEEVKLKTAIKYLNIEMELPSDDDIENLQIGLNNIYKTVSVLSGVSLDEVKEIPKSWIDRMAVKTSFMNTKPQPKRHSSIKWKELDEVSYDNFITYTQLQADLFNNMPTIIKAFSKTKLSDMEIMEMNIVDVHTAFFAEEAVRQINETYANIFNKAADEANRQRDFEEMHTLQAELNQTKSNIHKVFGWHFFAKRLGEYLGIPAPTVMTMSALDVFGWYMVMDADIQINNYKNTTIMNG